MRSDMCIVLSSVLSGVTLSSLLHQSRFSDFEKLLWPYSAGMSKNPNGKLIIVSEIFGPR